MALKATFTAGSDSTTVKGLYQWDYGQELEIESADIGSEIVEVHFASSNMSEAIVRSCTFANGVGTVIIPDACLEQATTVTAWIYQISGTQGHTIKTIIMPITARTRPSVNRDIPAEVSDKYTELITEVNEAVEALENGNVTVAKAVDATNAGYAASAGNAGTANYAIQAECDKNGKSITDTYATIADINNGKIKATYLNAVEASGTSSGTITGLEKGHVYVINFSIDIDSNGYPYNFQTVILYIQVTNSDGNIYSSKSYAGVYCEYKPDSSNKLVFYNSSNQKIDVYAVKYRKL